MGDTAATTAAALTEIRSAAFTEIRSAVDLLHGRVAVMDTTQQSLVAQLNLISDAVQEGAKANAEAVRHLAALDQRLHRMSRAVRRMQYLPPEEDGPDPVDSRVAGKGKLHTTTAAWTGNTPGASSAAHALGSSHAGADGTANPGGAGGGVLGGVGGGGLGGAGRGSTGSGYDSSKPSPQTQFLEARSDAEATMEARLTAIKASLNESRRLLASCARRGGVEKQKWQAATTPLFAATTTSLSAPDQARKQPEIKHSTMPIRCLTSGLDVNDNSNHSAVTDPSLGNTETSVIIPLELLLDKPLQPCIDLKFKPELGSRQTIGGVDHAVMALTIGLISADVIDPLETLTDVGSSSLFLKQVMNATDMVCDTMHLNEVWMSDEVLTHVSGTSIFLELCVPTAAEAFEGVLLMDRTWDQVLGKVPPWRLSGFSPGKCEHKHDLHLDNIDSSINEEIMHQLCVIARVWDPGRSSLWLGNTTPLDNMHLNFVCLIAEYIQDVLMCLLLAALEEKQAWDDQCTKTLNFNEVLQVEQAGCSSCQIIQGIFSTPLRETKHYITELCIVAMIIKFLFRALMPVLVDDKHKMFKKAMHGHLQQVTCEWKNTLPSSQPWHPSCMHYFLASAQRCENFSCYYDVAMSQSENYVMLRACKEIEYVMKLGTSSNTLGVKEFSSWTPQLFAAFVLFRGRQLLAFNSIHKYKDVCSLVISANKRQYMTWDPGVHSSVCAASLEVTEAEARDAGDSASFLQRSHCRISSYIVFRLRHGQAVAWGHATFCRDGNVTPGIWPCVG